MKDRSIMKLNLLGYDCKYLSKKEKEFLRCRKRNIICVGSYGCPDFKLKLSDEISVLFDNFLNTNNR